MATTYENGDLLVTIQSPTSIRVELDFGATAAGTTDIYVRKTDDYGTILYDLSIEGIAIEIGEHYSSYIITGLSPGTSYTITCDCILFSGNYSQVEFTMPWEEDEVEGFVINKVVTSNSATFTIIGDNTSYSEVTFTLCLYGEEDNGWWQDVKVGWEFGSAMPMETFEFTELTANTTYVLKAPELVGWEPYVFTTEDISVSISIQEVTSSSIKVRASESPDNNYDYWTWCIRKVGENTVLDKDGDSSGNRTKTFSNLESNTDYYIWLELESDSPESFDIVGVYVTTLPTEGLFYWTYSGIKKNDDGTYEHVLGGTKGVGADYFFITATEWNEYVTKLCEVKDGEGITDFTNDGTLDGLKVEPEQPFTATLYNMVLDILWNMEGNEGWTPDSERANPDNSITPSHLNGIRDRLNALMQ